MAKLRGAAKVAFLRRMAAGRRRARRAVGGTSTKRRVRRVSAGRSTVYGAAVRRRRRKNPMSALLVNPSWVPALYGGDSAARSTKKRRRKATKGATSMARKKRRKGTRKARRSTSPKKKRRVYRRRKGGGARRRRTRRSGGPFAARVRRGTRVIYINPRKRRRSYRRRRNGGGGLKGLLKRAFVPYAAGVITAGAAAMLDTGLAKWPVVRQVVKVGGVLAIASFLGRKHPNAAAAAIGALGASQGYPLVTKLAGGIVARTPAEAVKGLGEMTDTYPEMGALLQGGLGALLQGPSDVEDVTVAYETALNNMADDDDDS